MFDDNLPLGLAIAAFVLTVIGGIGWCVTWESAHSTVTCNVESKDRTTNHDGSSNVRIYTTDCGVFTISDDWVQYQLNSADLYGRILPGHRYDFTTVGWRNGLLSLFPNITSAVSA